MHLPDLPLPEITKLHVPLLDEEFDEYALFEFSGAAEDCPDVEEA